METEAAKLCEALPGSRVEALPMRYDPEPVPNLARSTEFAERLIQVATCILDSADECRPDKHNLFSPCRKTMGTPGSGTISVGIQGLLKLNVVACSSEKAPLTPPKCLNNQSHQPFFSLCEPSKTSRKLPGRKTPRYTKTPRQKNKERVRWDTCQLLAILDASALPKVSSGDFKAEQLRV